MGMIYDCEFSGLLAKAALELDYCSKRKPYDKKNIEELVSYIGKLETLFKKEDDNGNQLLFSDLLLKRYNPSIKTENSSDIAKGYNHLKNDLSQLEKFKKKDFVKLRDLCIAASNTLLAIKSTMPSYTPCF